MRDTHVQRNGVNLDENLPVLGCRDIELANGEAIDTIKLQSGTVSIWCDATESLHAPWVESTDALPSELRPFALPL